MAKTEQN